MQPSVTRFTQATNHHVTQYKIIVMVCVINILVSAIKLFTGEEPQQTIINYFCYFNTKK